MKSGSLKRNALILTMAIVVWTGLWDGVSASLPHKIKTHRELRYGIVVPQSTWFTCGPASVATLVTHFLEMPTSEADVVELALAAGQEDVLEFGFSLLALKKALSELGIESRGYQLDMDSLRDYFERGGLPLITHVTRPEAHFVVAVGTVANHLVLADPSTGLYTIPVQNLMDFKGFTGNVLVVIPEVTLLQTARDKQRSVIHKFHRRRTQLAELGGRLR